MLKEWVTFNKLENFNSILNYSIDDFTPANNLCYVNERGEILHQTPMHELFNLRCYIQHLIDENEDEITKKDAKAHLEAPSQGFQGFLVLVL